MEKRLVDSELQLKEDVGREMRQMRTTIAASMTKQNMSSEVERETTMGGGRSACVIYRIYACTERRVPWGGNRDPCVLPALPAPPYTLLPHGMGHSSQQQSNV